MDGQSDDGKYAIAIIALVGNVFSPWYFDARKQNVAADPLDFPALNLALYGPGRGHWCLTEYDRAALRRTEESLDIGRNHLEWNGDALQIDVCDRTAVFGAPVEGVIRVVPEVINAHAFAIDVENQHTWQPIAPRARISVEFKKPHVRWQGTAYIDTNAGDVPLESSFRKWTWAQASFDDSTLITYDMELLHQQREPIHILIDSQGAMTEVAPAEKARLAPTRWLMPSTIRCDVPFAAHRVESLEDTPFYARSRIRTSWLDKTVVAMQEELSLERFASPLVRKLLPYRMRRELSR